MRGANVGLPRLLHMVVDFPSLALGCGAHARGVCDGAGDNFPDLTNAGPCLFLWFYIKISCLASELPIIW